MEFLDNTDIIRCGMDKIFKSCQKNFTCRMRKQKLKPTPTFSRKF